MRTQKNFLSVFFLLLTGSLFFSSAAFAQLTVLSYSPAATETPSGSHYYIINDPVPSDAIALTWNFSKGLDAKFVQDISNITVKEKGSPTELAFDTSAGTRTQPAPGYEADINSLLIQNADFTYLKVGSGSDPVQFRRLTLMPTTVAFKPNKIYVVTIDNATAVDNGTIRTFQSNNSNILDFAYSFEFETIEPGEVMAITAFAPAATATSADPHYYIVNDPIPRDTITFQWNVSLAMDTAFGQNIHTITVQEKGSAEEFNFDLSSGATISPIPGSSDNESLRIANADFIYTEEQGARTLALTPTTRSFEPNTTYVIKIYPQYGLSAFQSNTGKTLNATYAFEFTTANEGSADLTAFTARPRSWRVVLQWTTASEKNIAGYNIQRATSADGPFSPVNGDVIPATGSETEAASYRFIDRRLRNRTTYYYRLEAVDTNADPLFLGSANAQPRLIYLFFPPR